MYDNASFVACLEHSDDPLSDSAKSSRTESAAPHQDGGDTFGMEGAKCLEQVLIVIWLLVTTMLMLRCRHLLIVLPLSRYTMT